VVPRVRPAPFVAASLAAVAFALVAPPSAPAQMIKINEGEDFLNTTFVGDEAETARLAFYRAEELLGGKQAKEAGREIMKLLRGEPRGLVRYGERLVVPVETAALLFLLRLPDAVRVELAREEVAAGTLAPPVDRDVGPLRDFAFRHPLAAAGEQALLEAGVRELLAGEAGAAAADLERLVHWPSAWPGATRNVAAARLLEAQARSGGYADGPITHWPRGDDATIARGGSLVRIDDLRAGTRPSPEPKEDLSGNPAFVDAWPEPPLDGVGETARAPHRWRFSLRQESPNSDAFEGLRDLPTRAPVVLPGPEGDRIATVEADGVHVRRIAGGAEAFAPLRFDFDLHVDPRVAVPDVDRSGLTLSGNRLYLTLTLTPPRRAFGGTFFVEAATTALFAFDLRRECYVEFAVTSADLERDPELAGYVFSGPVVASAGRLFVSASRLVGRETECALLAFDAKSGAPAGHLLLARAANVPVYRDRLTNDDVWRVVPSPVVVRDGIAFVCTNVGLMAAVRTADLGLVWGFRYHRRDSPESEKFARDCLYLTGGWLGRPPVVLADRVVATPSDSNYAYVFARWPDARGDLVLNDPIQREERMALVGADAQSLYFVQRTGDAGAPRWFIEATDHDGVIRWSSVKLPAGERFAGVPVLTRSHLFVATDHVIYPIVLAREGSFYDRPIGLPDRVGQPPPEVAGFGDLAVSGRYLFSTSALYTLVFESAKE